VLLILLGSLLLPTPGRALDFFFQPDTTIGNVGQTVLLSGQIGASPLMRGFTVYMAYDTNTIDLYEPPEPGTLIAGHSGLDFNYFDHAPFAPNRLEIGGTIFGTDFWQGPGELFRVRFLLRRCADAPITAPFPPFFVDASEGFPPVIFYPAAVFVCERVPQSPQELTIHPDSPTSVILRWSPVTQDIFGRALFAPPSYRVTRQQILPFIMPVETVATVSSLFFVESLAAGDEYTYEIIAVSGP
jgi:hypothetical protein